jgi:hypothetical protein
LIEASCHCGAIRIELPRKPRTLTECNCSICRRYGTRWAYYEGSNVGIQAPRGGLDSYAWGEKNIRFMRCRRCGCVMYWQGTRKPRGRMGVNMRNVQPEALAGVRVRHLDGASTWKFLD